MRILVCGGRDFCDDTIISYVLMRVHQERGISLLIHGAARGADSRSAAWAARNNVPVKEFKADWQTHGRAAGPLRNQQMLDEGKPDAAVAFPGGTGTKDMISRAKKAGVPVWEPRVI